MKEHSNINRREFLTILGSACLSIFPNYNHFINNNLDIRNNNRPNIIILVFDALSAKNMSLYGYRRKTTPYIDKLVNKATIFHRHYAGANFTSPGVATILTGTYPWKHRALQFYSTVTPQAANYNLFKMLNLDYYVFSYTHNPLANTLLYQFRDDQDKHIELETLLEELDSLTTVLFNDDLPIAFRSEMYFLKDYSPFPFSLYLTHLESMRREYKQKKINNLYKEKFPKGLPNWPIGPSPIFQYTLEEAIDWALDHLPKFNQPFFGYYHLFPPHQPYNSRQDFIGNFDDGWSPKGKPIILPERYSYESQEKLDQWRIEYDEFVAYVDFEFNRLYEGLYKKGMLDNTYIFLTSDHGELFERGIHEHITPALYEPVINIPLIVFKPGQTKRKDIYELSSNVDLLPTILKLAGKPISDFYEGQHLNPITSDDPMSSISIYAVEAKGNPKNAPLEKSTFTILRDKYKLIYYKGYEEFEDFYEFYNLYNDPEEMENLTNQKHPMMKELMEELSIKLKEEKMQWKI
jgi:arylsulfatase A-like enzyme